MEPTIAPNAYRMHNPFYFNTETGHFLNYLISLSKNCKKGFRYFIAFLIRLVYLATIKWLCRGEMHKTDKNLTQRQDNSRSFFFQLPTLKRSFKTKTSIDPFYLKTLKYIFIREYKIKPIKKVKKQRKCSNSYRLNPILCH